MPFKRSSYQIVQDTPDVLVIEDIGHDVMSVTNDAEAVVEELAFCLHGRRLEYYDSQGQRGQLLVVDGKFAGFAPAERKP
jgi:hypothetical protein